VGTLGVILAAVYLLTMLQKAFFGPVGSFPLSHPVPDMVGREAWSVLPLLVLCLVIGVYPKPLIDTVKPDIDSIAGIYARLHVDRVASAPGDKLEVRR
jgi:NADH-quinone oxidoreductase subunit M